MIADIATGNTGFADVMFLVALILGVLAAIVALANRPAPPGLSLALGWLAVAAIGLGFLVL